MPIQPLMAFPQPEATTQTLPASDGYQESTFLPVDGDAALDPPSLPPHKIAEFSRQFATDAAPYYALWRECTDVVSMWRGSPVMGIGAFPTQQGVVQWMRPRDVSVPLIQPLFRNVVARLSVETPAVGVVPATEAADDIAKAQASEQAARYHYRQADMREVLRQLIEWLALHGTGGLLTYMEGDDVAEEAVEPERLRAEPGVTSPEQSRFLAVTRVTTKDELKRQFPHAWKAIEEAQPPKQSMLSNGRVGQREAPDRVEVLEAYCRSGHWYMLVGDGGTVLAQGMTPGRCMPLQIVRYTRVPGQFFGMGVVELARDVQYAYSALINQVLRNARLMSSPKVLIDRAAKVDENAFTSSVGEKVLYSGVKPDVWVPPPLPAYVQNLLPSLQSLMHDLTGIHSTSTGKRATGISSGRAIEALSANDMAQFQSTQDAIEHAVTKSMRCALLYMQEYYPEQKMVRQFDQYGRSVFQTLRKTDIADNPEVFLESGTLFSAEVKDRDQRTLDLMRLGLLGPEEGRKMLSFHLDPMAPVKTIADIEHARKVLSIVAGAPDGTPLQVDIYPSDNLKVFDDVVGGFIRSPTYEALSPDRQDAVHKLYLQIIAMQAPPDPTAPKNEDGKIPQLPGAPKEAGGGMMPGAMDTTRPADAAVDAAEAADDQTI